MSLVWLNCSSTSMVSTADSPPPPYSTGILVGVEAELARLVEDRLRLGRIEPSGFLDPFLERYQFAVDKAPDGGDDHLLLFAEVESHGVLR